MSAESVCTVCGARQPLVAGLEAAVAREAWIAALALWGDPGGDTLAIIARYVDWITTADRTPQPRSVARCLADLGTRMASGTVTSAGLTRPAPVAAWIEAMRLIVDEQTEAVRPLRTNGYLAGIVWHRAAASPSARPAAAGPPVSGPGAGPSAVGPPARREALAHVQALRALLAGAHDQTAQESLRRQIEETESRLWAAGDSDERNQ